MVVSFHELAERELTDAAEYYGQRQSGLGTAFITEVQRRAYSRSDESETAAWVLGGAVVKMRPKRLHQTAALVRHTKARWKGDVVAYSFMDLVFDVLEIAKHPLTYQEIWQAGQHAGLASKVRTAGKTPWNTLGAQVYVDVRDNDASRFIKVGKRPARFFLKARSNEITDEVAAKIETAVEPQPKSKTSYKERDLHPVLTRLQPTSRRVIPTRATAEARSTARSGNHSLDRCMR